MNSPRIILFVTNNYTPYCGGVARSIQVVRAALRSQGHVVWLVTLDFTGNSVPGDDEHVERLWCPIHFTYKKNPMAVPWRPYRALERIVERVQPDIIHSHHPFFLGQIALKIARSRSIPIVYTYHTLYEEYLHYIPLPQWVVRPCIRATVQTFCKQVDGVIAPSKAIQERLKRSVIPVPSVVIPSPIRSYFFSGDGQIMYDKSAIPFRLLCVSRFVKEKNLPFLLQLMTRLNSKYFALTLVGYGAERAALEQYAYGTLGLDHRAVNFVHKPEQDELVTIYRTAHLFVFSSTSDTQGLVLAEAMASGLPVVALDGPGQRDIIINGVNGFIVDSLAQMCNVVQRIADNPGLYSLLCTQARGMARRYAPAQLGERLTEFYEQALRT